MDWSGCDLPGIRVILGTHYIHVPTRGMGAAFCIPLSVSHWVWIVPGQGWVSLPRVGVLVAGDNSLEKADTQEPLADNTQGSDLVTGNEGNLDWGATVSITFH